MGAPVQAGARLVESQMPVSAYAQYLQLHLTPGDDSAELLNIGFNVPGALGHIGVGLVDVDVVEQVAVHEIAVALVVGGLQPDVLVQVHGADLAEVQPFLLAAAGKLLIHADGAGPGGQTQAAVRLLPDDLLDDIRAGGALACIVVANDNFHISPPSVLKNQMTTVYYVLIFSSSTRGKISKKRQNNERK